MLATQKVTFEEKGNVLGDSISESLRRSLNSVLECGNSSSSSSISRRRRRRGSRRRGGGGWIKHDCVGGSFMTV